jgi:hypothetical protein
MVQTKLILRTLGGLKIIKYLPGLIVADSAFAWLKAVETISERKAQHENATVRSCLARRRNRERKADGHFNKEKPL